MPSTYTYPGVYVEEIPSGVRTLTGVATSVTAFLGRAPRGPVNKPRVISSFRDYERLYGGLWLDSTMSYAVNDFFRNGGSQAVIVRLYKPQLVGNAAVPGTAKLTLDTSLQLEALSPGAWGNNLTAVVDYLNRDSDATKDLAKSWGVDPTDLFNLTVTYTAAANTAVERFTNVTYKDCTNRVDRVLAQQSKLVRFARDPNNPSNPALPVSTTPPAATPAGTVISPIAGSALDSDKLTVSTDYPMTTLDAADGFNLLCIPPDLFGGDTGSDVYNAAMTYCAARRAVLIVDPPKAWSGKTSDQIKVSDLLLSGPYANSAAVYYPRVMEQNPLRGGQLEEFVPCGIVAGIIARTDVQRGVWKAPAGLDAALSGVDSLTVKLTDTDSGRLNPQGINCLRSFPVTGQVVWGARTLRGSDLLSDDYKYLPVRRLALYIEESVYRGTQWVVFEPNDEPLWSQVRLNIGAFMQTLFRQGAFAGQSPRDAYFVKCDKESTTATDQNNGVVNIVIGFAPLKPAEFVVIKFQQIAGQVAA